MLDGPLTPPLQDMPSISYAWLSFVIGVLLPYTERNTWQRAGYSDEDSITLADHCSKLIEVLMEPEQ